MFIEFLFRLREQGLPVGVGQWLLFLRGLSQGLAVNLDELYGFSRSIMCGSENHYDAFDLAFSQTFQGVVLAPDQKKQLLDWLAEAQTQFEGQRVDHGWSDEELLRQLLQRLAEQQEKHSGGNYWVGTGGTSPFGHSGGATSGIRIGGTGGGKGAIRVAMERSWSNYRNDRTLDVRDLEVVLRTLRSLARDGTPIVDLDETISETARNGGDIEIVERPDRKNQLRVVLLMDVGGSMAPHAQRVERLFSAASNVRTFRSLETYYFHNCVYQNLYRDMAERDRVPTSTVMANLTPRHRLILVGDASMAPYELFSAWGWGEAGAPTGLDWLKRLRSRCPASIWLNPDPVRWWQHPTVSAIARIYPMYELTAAGLADGVKRLRAPV